MDRRYLIPIAALLAGCTAKPPEDTSNDTPTPSGPDFVGDWELTRLNSSGGGYSIDIEEPNGDLRIADDGDAEMKINWVQKYDGTSYSYEMDLDGDAKEDGDDAFTLKIDGTFRDGFADTYSIEMDLDCEINSDEADCEGPMIVDGETYAATLNFKAK